LFIHTEQCLFFFHFLLLFFLLFQFGSRVFAHIRKTTKQINNNRLLKWFLSGITLNILLYSFAQKKINTLERWIFLQTTGVVAQQRHTHIIIDIVLHYSFFFWRTKSISSTSDYNLFDTEPLLRRWVILEKCGSATNKFLYFFIIFFLRNVWDDTQRRKCPYLL
jgi:hypothetical protein